MDTQAPIPPPRDDDPEDVNWSLSTAATLWGRGERAEAMKWLRRAAEQASDGDADERALELMKVAADVTTLLSTPPPPSTAPSVPPGGPPPLPKKSTAPPALPVRSAGGPSQ